MLEVIDTTAIQQELLIDSVACDDPEFKVFLAENVSTAWCIAGQTCHDDVQWLQAQLHLIELGQGFVRNKIDISQSQSQSNGESVSSSSSYRDAQAQRTAQNTSCNFAESTSFQQFVRDAESSSRSGSDTVSDATGESLSTTTDRSTSAAQGWATSFDTGATSTRMDGTGYSVSHSESHSEGHTRSGQPNLGPGWSIDPGFPGFTETPPFVDDPVDNGYFNPGPQRGLNCPDACTGDVIALPNYGRGYNASYTVSLAFIVFGVGLNLNFSWSDGANFRQSHTVTNGCATAGGTSATHSESDSSNLANSNGESLSHDESSSVRDAHTVGDSERDSRSDTHAASSSISQSHGETHSGSDRHSHSEGQGAQQGTAWSRSHSEGKARSDAKSVATSMTRKWSQIFRSLQDMWERVFAEIQEAELQHAASLGARMGMMSNQTMQIPCNPYAANLDKVRRQPCPVFKRPLPEQPVWGGDYNPIHTRF